MIPDTAEVGAVREQPEGGQLVDERSTDRQLTDGQLTDERFTDGRSAAALVDGLPGLDPSWSRRLDVVDADGIPRTWHLLERPAGDSDEHTVGTMLCLHGNPTWSYLWRRFLAAAPPGWRVIAPDQLGMGWSERLELPRTAAQRIDDLGRLTDALHLTGPVVAIAHDWGGPVLLGWAERHRHLLAGLVLTNTGVAIPAHTAPPGLITLARSAPLLDAVCRRTPAFVRATTALSRPPLPPDVRDAFASPYAIASRRRAVRDFVADIPLESGHPSRSALDDVAARLDGLSDVPALLVWGPRDPVFSIRYLHDLRRRLPQADVQIYPRASHLVVEDAPEAAADVWRWVGTLTPAPAPAPDRDRDRDRPGRHFPSTDANPDTPTRGNQHFPSTDAKCPPAARPSAPAPTDEAAPAPEAAPEATPPLWAGLLERAHDSETAIAELGPDAQPPISFAELERRVTALAAGLVRGGVRPGQRVAVLVPPGIDLTVAVYACWRAGAAIVVADAGLGLRNLGRALRSADPDHLIAIPAGLAAAHALRVPGRRVVVGTLSPQLRRVLRAPHSLTELEADGRAHPGTALPATLGSEAEAAVLFTSGATGPAKGVVYRHRQLRAQLDLVREVCRLDPNVRMVAAFAPFALYGPALGAAAAVPDMDVTKPGTLTASALAEAVAAVDATVVFASPAALRNVAATAGDLTPDLRRRLGTVTTLLSAGAPVPLPLLRRIQTLLPGATLHTPYGMTEALPTTDVTLPEIEQALTDLTTAGGRADTPGVCVGRPLPGVRVEIAPLDRTGRPAEEPGSQVGVTGEICVAGAHVKDHYDRLWVTQQDSATPSGWHRTGDVGHLDGEGRLWVEGRLVHVITGPDGPVTPVGVEQRTEALPGIAMAAAVGVGPAGTQATVLVVVPTERAAHRRPLAPAPLARAVREAAGTPVAAVLVTDRLPVDIRHASKIDRARVARWAELVLAGHAVRGRTRRP